MILLRHELGWLPPMEDVFVALHVSSCPACTLDCTVLRFAADLVGIGVTPTTGDDRSTVSSA